MAQTWHKNGQFRRLAGTTKEGVGRVEAPRPYQIWQSDGSDLGRTGS
jgi:hypothetical protein